MIITRYRGNQSPSRNVSQGNSRERRSEALNHPEELSVGEAAERGCPKTFRADQTPASLHPERLPGTGYDRFLYHITDHLGSVRVVRDGTGAVVQRFDHYLFELISESWSSGTNPSQPSLRYRFSGKELAGQSVEASTVAGALAAGTPYLDFGARIYDPRTAAWLSQDPLSEKYYSISHYAYCAGNPVNLVDPTGKDIWDKLVGFLVGYLTNTIPRTSFVRDLYSPTSSADYNNVLQNIDRAAEVVGDLALTSAAIEGTTGAAMTAAGGGLSASVVGAPEGLAVAGSGAALIAETAKLGVVGTLFKANFKSNQAGGYERGGTYNGETSKESKSLNQLQKDVERGNAPKGIDRFDKGNATLGEKDHVHFKDGSALNIDGTWKHGYRNLKTKEIKYLERNGWKLSK